MGYDKATRTRIVKAIPKRAATVTSSHKRLHTLLDLSGGCLRIDSITQPGIQQRFRHVVDAPPLALSRTGDVQGHDVVLVQPAIQSFSLPSTLVCRSLDHHARFAKFPCKSLGCECTTIQLTEIDDERPVTVRNVFWVLCR